MVGKNILRQYYATLSSKKITTMQLLLIKTIKLYIFFIVNLITLSLGSAMGYASPFLPLLMSDKTPLLSGPITIEESSWIASLFCIGALNGTFIFGALAEYFGRKPAALCMTFPIFICWILTLCAKSVEFLYIARFIGGLSSGGLFIIVPLYVGEIAENK